MNKICLALGLVLILVLCTGCSRSFLGGAAVGAGGAGAAYEYSNKQALNDLEDDFEDGEIDREEYLRRKEEIEDRSVVY